MISRLRIYAVIFLSSILFAIGINMFLVPSQVVSGGFTGLAHILNIMFKLPIGVVVILLNIPFIILNTKLLGTVFLKKAAVGVVLSGVMTELIDVGGVSTNRVLNAVMGGFVLGIAMGVMFFMGYTTGGTDFVATLIKEKIRRITIGTAIFWGDCIVIALAFLVIRDMVGVMLAVLSIFVQSKTIDVTMKRLAAI